MEYLYDIELGKINGGENGVEVSGTSVSRIMQAGKGLEGTPEDGVEIGSSDNGILNLSVFNGGDTTQILGGLSAGLPDLGASGGRFD